MSAQSLSLQNTQTASNSGVLSTHGSQSHADSSRTLLRVLERYRLSCVLGRGGMAEVFLAAWQVAPEVVRPVVVKRLHSHFGENANLARMFIDEARLVCQLDHENIVKTYEAGLIDNHLCIAMEYLEGQTLQQLVRRAYDQGGLPVSVALFIATRVLAALEFAHEAVDQRGNSREIVHRDISPHNVFVTNNGQVKVLDFGIAKAKDQGPRTSTGIVKGKFAYIAPEQALGQGVDARADVWSLGVVLWEMLAGRRLFKADGDAATLNATLHREIPLLTSVNPDVPIGLASTVARALQRDRGKRYQTASAMLVDLNRQMERCSPRPDQATLSRLMHLLFTEEISLQQRLVGDLILLHQTQGPDSSRPTAAQQDTVVASDPGEVSNTSTLLAVIERSRRRNRALVIALLSVLAILVGSIAWLSGDRTVPPVQHARELAPVSPPAVSSLSPSTFSKVVEAREPPETKNPIAPAASVLPSMKTASVTEPVPTPARRRAARMTTSPSIQPAATSESSNSVKSVATDADTTLGFLTIDTTPWSNVSIRGKMLGQTPIVKARLPAGTHTLTLRNPDLGLETQYSVTIEPNTTIVKRVGLR
jgi:eukaryotic-like serine/threonine-protein kinase